MFEKSDSSDRQKINGFSFQQVLRESVSKTLLLRGFTLKQNTKWTYHKEWSFPRNYFIFLKILFQFKNLL